MLFGISLLHGFFLVKTANIIINHLTFLAWLVAETHMLFLLSVSTLLFMGLWADSPLIACLKLEFVCHSLPHENCHKIAITSTAENLGLPIEIIIESSLSMVLLNCFFLIKLH